MGSAIQLVQLTPTELQEMLSAAVAEGVQKGVLLAKEMLGEEQAISKQEAMRLSGYRDDPSFRQFCKDNKIEVHEKRGKSNYYLPSQIRQAQRTKGIRIK